MANPRTVIFYPKDVLERHQRVDRTFLAAVAEMFAIGNGTGKMQKIAAKMDFESLTETA